MKENTVIDLAKTICDLLHNYSSDDLFPEGVEIGIQVHNPYPGVLLKTVYILNSGKPGHKYELYTDTMFSDEWEAFKAGFKPDVHYPLGMSCPIIVKGEFYDPDEKKQT